MTVELGQIALLAALLTAFSLGLFPMIGTYTGNRRLMAVSTSAALIQCLLLIIAFGILTSAFVNQDFSVEYVARNSNSLLPMMYRYSAVWSAHEGSLLLWELILCLWIAAVALFSNRLPEVFRARVLAVLGWISAGFLLFILFTSNPFGRLIPSAAEGLDLNPLLQDFGLIVHPPLLYMGYVGFSVAFAFAVAALLGGEISRDWVRWSRPWTLVAWAFLTIGIALGSWWAYYELGWGGWWFWDPVENASIMPWLVGTALMHSLAVTEKRGAFKSWTVLLALFAFSLSLLGTFLVRSGVLTSVHAFATDPTRGTFILVFLCLVIGGSLTLYAWRAPSISSGGRFDLVSRESFLLGNNLILTLFCALVLFGTLAPLIYEALGWGKISVGFPWFNKMFVYLMPLLVLMMAVGPLARWKHTEVSELVRLLWLPLALSLAIGIAALFMAGVDDRWYVALGVFLTAWLLLSLLTSLKERYKHKGLGSALADFAGKGRSYYGMWLAHIGVAMFIIGATLVSNYGIEKDIRMSPGDSYEMEGYTFVFEGVSTIPGPNYNAHRGRFRVLEDGEEIALLEPEKRTYLVQNRPMTEAAIGSGLTTFLFFFVLGRVRGGEHD